jgi:hypothetical protein
MNFAAVFGHALQQSDILWSASMKCGLSKTLMAENGLDLRCMPVAKGGGSSAFARIMNPVSGSSGHPMSQDEIQSQCRLS